ncbi:MAG: hypothetical protein KC613_02790 [Myxococcales bacterium]|nr:hypothetical protein [Myxococcales bacterium]MCB9521757.1 hypothetical protein [Myxococcales bacterium]
MSEQTLAALPLAGRWPGVLGLPYHYGAVAAGQRVELLPTGYGVGGAALLVTRRGQRTLVVGPTTEALEARRAEDLVLCAPAAVLAPLPHWLAELAAARRPTRVSVPDSGAAHVLVQALEGAGLPWRGPRWLGAPTRGAAIQITVGGPGRHLDLRPQARLGWLVDYALAVGPQAVSVYGPRAHTLADGLTRVGLPAAVIHGPLQLTLDEPPLPRPRPRPEAPRRTEGPTERR